MEDPKAIKKSISFPSDLLAFSEKCAVRAHGGNLSRYVQTLIYRDQKGTLALDAKGKAPLAELARVFHPTRELFFSEEMGEFDQGLIIMRFLEALLDAVRRGDSFEPEAPFRLYNSTDQLLQAISNKTLKEKFGLIQEVVDDMIAAEEPAPYNKKPTKPKA